MSSPNTQFKIAIVGAGLGGLAAARTLQQNDIECTVYELDASPNSRPQGGTLDMHMTSGQLALRTNGLWDKILPHIRYEGEDLRIADKTGKIWLENVANTSAADPTQDTRPEVDRGVLRQTYLDSVKESTIHWGTHVKRIIPVESQGGERRPRYILVFSNGEEETFDFVIGADGAWSRVRALISDAKPTYSGVTMVETRLLNVDEMHPAEAKVVGRGSMYAISDNKAVMAQRNGDGTIRNYVALRIPENGLPEEEFRQESTAKAYLLGQFDDWCEDFKSLIRCGQGVIPRAINVLPAQHHWTSRPGITIIGDAAHLMTPFAGEGANLAMIDGVDLGLMLVKAVKGSEDLATCQQEFEKAMIQRSQRASEMSSTSLDLFISADAPRSTMPFLQRMMSQEPATAELE